MEQPGAGRPLGLASTGNMAVRREEAHLDETTKAYRERPRKAAAAATGTHYIAAAVPQLLQEALVAR